MYFKHNSNFFLPLVTFEVKPHIMKNLCLYDISIHVMVLKRQILNKSQKEISYLKLRQFKNSGKKPGFGSSKLPIF